MNQLRDIIRAEIHSTADEIRRLKRWLRTPPDQRPEPPVTRFALWPSKQRATLLCTIMAHSRGRLHLRSTESIDQVSAPLRGAARPGRAGAFDQQGAQLVEALDAMDKLKHHTPLLDAALRTAARAILARRGQSITPNACVAPTVERRA